MATSIRVTTPPAPILQMSREAWVQDFFARAEAQALVFIDGTAAATAAVRDVERTSGRPVSRETEGQIGLAVVIEYNRRREAAKLGRIS